VPVVLQFNESLGNGLEVLNYLGVFAGEWKILESEIRPETFLITECSNILPNASLELARFQCAIVSLINKWKRA